MKFKDPILAAMALFWVAVYGTQAQAPASISGTTLILATENGSAPLANSGAELLLPANSGTGYSLISVTNLATSTGTYSYSPSNADGLLTANDSKVGAFNGDFTFDDDASGTFAFTQTSSGAYQNGTFALYSGQAPASLAGKTLDLNIQGGTSGSGTATAVFTASSVTLSAGSTSGTVPYSYSILNTSAGKITASELGVTVTAYFAFSDPANGGFAVEDSSGYEYGTFNIPDHTPPTLQITAPTAGLLVSNASYTITGTAADNVAVSNVVYSFNSGPWTNAEPVNGWSNWNAAVTLQPGTNSVAAFAMDTSGNVSTTNTVRFVYVITAPLTVSTNGMGSLNPNDNGAQLRVGQTYFITATAATGFAFTNWSGGTNIPLQKLTNGPTVEFTMVSNLMLQATFVDVAKPTLSITNITSGMTVSNAAFTMAGKSADNAAVADVFYSLNNADFTNASPGINWSNWTAAVTLIPGTNTIAAYAEDTSGNLSTTDAVKLVYIVSATLTVSTNGRGTLSQNYNNALLQVGRNYSITATAATGFAFTNWSGGTNLPLTVITGNSTVQFTMVSNLMLQANFVDVAKPTLGITNITSGMTVSNASFTVRGTAGDNVAVANVFYSLNNSDWSNAIPVNNWSNWNAAVTLLPGTNTIAAYSVDTSGNASTIDTVKLFYAVPTVLTISTNGLGTLSQNYNGAQLQIGRNYTISATPASGFQFTNWTGGTTLPLVWLTNGATLQFTMVSNLMLQANFVDVTRPTVTITAPTSGQHMTNAVATVRGTASDNWKVAGVWYQLNSGAWNAPVTTNGWTNWTTTVPLQALTNTVKAYALDLGGNYSLTSSVSFVSSNAFKLQLAFTSAQPATAAGLNFNLQLSTGLNGHIQVSTNLMDWVILTNFIGTNANIGFTDPAATNSIPRFYRAVIP